MECKEGEVKWEGRELTEGGVNCEKGSMCVEGEGEE